MPSTDIHNIMRKRAIFSCSKYLLLNPQNATIIVALCTVLSKSGANGYFSNHKHVHNLQLSSETMQKFFVKAVDEGKYEAVTTALAKIKSENSTCDQAPEQGKVMMAIFKDNPSYGLRNVDMYVAAKMKSWLTELGVKALASYSENEEPGKLSEAVSSRKISVSVEPRLMFTTS